MIEDRTSRSEEDNSRLLIQTVYKDGEKKSPSLYLRLPIILRHSLRRLQELFHDRHAPPLRNGSKYSPHIGHSRSLASTVYLSEHRNPTYYISPLFFNSMQVKGKKK